MQMWCRSAEDQMSTRDEIGFVDRKGGAHATSETANDGQISQPHPCSLVAIPFITLDVHYWRATTPDLRACSSAEDLPRSDDPLNTDLHLPTSDLAGRIATRFRSAAAQTRWGPTAAVFDVRRARCYIRTRCAATLTPPPTHTPHRLSFPAGRHSHPGPAPSAQQWQ
jgi:hypothetical protein